MEKIAEQFNHNGIEVSEIIGDTAYSAKENIDYCNESNVKLVSKLNPAISNAATFKEDGFI